jgi:hypothetical protein
LPPHQSPGGHNPRGHAVNKGIGQKSRSCGVQSVEVRTPPTGTIIVNSDLAPGRRGPRAGVRQGASLSLDIPPEEVAADRIEGPSSESLARPS